ncbi:MAG: ATP-grasp domain-containing protein [Bacillota bacterium]
MEKKKILILGGTFHMVNVVETAKRIGYHTIVTDNMIGSPAKKIADQSYDVSTSDINKLAEIGRREQIDGVFTAFDDINTWHAVALCKTLNLPFYATPAQLEITSHKDRFKDYCRTFGVAVIEEYECDPSQDAELPTVEFPVIVKPVDSYASKGITVCYEEEELKKGVEKAVSESKSGKIMLERFVDSDIGVQAFYTARDGHIVLTAVTDRFTHKQAQEHPPLPVAMLFPSRHQEQYMKEVDPSVRKMIRGMGIENGLVFIQTMYDGGKIYVYEMGFRFSGEQHYHIIHKQTGVHLLEMMLDFSVGEDTACHPIEQFDHAPMPYPSANLPILLGPGTIAEIKGLEKVKAMPEVISCVINRSEGETIERSGSYSQMFGRFNLVANSQQALLETIEQIYGILEIRNEDGMDMIMARFHSAKMNAS